MKIFQALDALDYGDGVGNDVINKEKALKELGFETKIYAKFCHEKVRGYFNDISEIKVNSEDIIMHHFSGKSHIIEDIKRLRCKKILVYHNITPKEFFKDNNVGKMCEEGLGELKENAKEYDYFIADSEYNLSSLRELGIKSEGAVLPILIDFAKFEEPCFTEIRDNANQMIFLFTGRVAPNKKHIDIIKIFEYFFCYINNNSKLYLVGDYCNYMDNFQEIIDYLETTKCRDNVVFTGKVNDEQLCNYYKNSDIFLCMSEHEGFCIPLLESMYCRVLTIAYDAGAVASTMGKAGVLVNNKNPNLLAKMIHTIQSDILIKNQVLSAQEERVEAFSKEAIKLKLEQFIFEWGKK